MEARTTLQALGGVDASAKLAFETGLDAALALGQLDTVEDLLAEIEAIPPGKRPPSLRGQAARFRALLAAAQGRHDSAEQGFKTAAAIFREHRLAFYLALTECEHGEWLLDRGRADAAEPLLAEAREIFQRLEATSWLARLDALTPAAQLSSA